MKDAAVLPQWGQVQPSGRSLKAVPGFTSFSGSPTAGSYSLPQPRQTPSFLAFRGGLGTFRFIFTMGGAGCFSPVSRALASRGRITFTSPTMP